MASQDFLLRVGDGKNFLSSSRFGIWSACSSLVHHQWFLNAAKPGDHLWFVTNGTGGKLLAVATYMRQVPRGPTTRTNAELGWIHGENDADWVSDIEIHFKDLYMIDHMNLKTEIQAARPMRLYNEKCKVNLPQEYPMIQRYVKPTVIET